MANKTIYGCVDRATGQIKFIGEACDSGDYTGCIVRTGIHAGQVKVVILEDYCDDTYYGCVERDTGRFKLEIPYCCDSACFYCIGFKSPWAVQVVLSLFSNCTKCVVDTDPNRSKKTVGNLAPIVNGIHVLETTVLGGCNWDKWIPVSEASIKRWNSVDNCSGTPDEVYAINWCRIRLTVSGESHLYVQFYEIQQHGEHYTGACEWEWDADDPREDCIRTNLTNLTLKSGFTCPDVAHQFQVRMNQGDLMSVTEL